MSNPNPSASTAGPPRWFPWFGGLALLAYTIILALNLTTAAGGSDSSGYLNSARLLTEGQLATTVRIPPEMGPADSVFRPDFQPLGFIATAESSRLVPTYPTGLPLHFAVAMKILGGVWGPRLCEIGAALAALVLCFAVGRELGLSAALAGAGAVVLAACPVMLYTSIQPLSDTLATTWCLAAVWSALVARRRPRWSAICGAAFAVAVLVRPTNLVLLPALVTLLGFRWRKLALFVLAGAPAAGWLAFYNHHLYGGVLRSGYPALETAFAASYVAPTAWHFLHWLAIFIPVVLLALPLVALARRDLRTREMLALGLWFWSIMAVYLCYAISHEAWTCLRFILPALPALILGGILGVEALARAITPPWAGRVRMATAAALALWAVTSSTLWSRSHAVFFTKGYENAYTAAALAARDQFPKNALVLCCNFSGSLYFYTDFPVLRWDFLNPADFTRYATRAAAAHLPLCALVFDSEQEDALRAHCPGAWQRISSVGNIGLWRLGAPATGTEAK